MAVINLTWSSPVNRNITWIGKSLEIPKVIEYVPPVRRNNPQTMTYTFKNEANAVIALTAYLSVKLWYKVVGGSYLMANADFYGDRSLGKVRIVDHRFLTVGIWDAQFVCYDTNANLLYGDIIQLKVIENVDDLETNTPAAF